MEFCLESKDLDGRADWENGVVGEVRAAAVLALPLAFEGKDVASWGDDSFKTGVAAGCLLAERAMYVSTHLAIMVCSYSPGSSKSKNLPALRAKIMLSLYSPS